MSKSKRYYTYILQCSDDTLYTGYTVDLHLRLAVHNRGKGAKYTRARLPVRLVYACEFPSKGEAQSFEASIKQLSRSKKLLLIDNWQGLPYSAPSVGE